MEPLLYAELINPENKAGNILNPRAIPIHPAVFAYDGVFKQPFIDSVMKAVPESIKRDLAEIERILDLNLDMIVTEEGIKYGSREISLRAEDTIHTKAYTRDEQSVDVTYMGANIAMLREGYAVAWEPSVKNHGNRMPEEKLKDYLLEIAPEYGKAHRVWYTHNILDYGLPLELFFRNFAIMFNNLGIEEAKRNS